MNSNFNCYKSGNEQLDAEHCALYTLLADVVNNPNQTDLRKLLELMKEHFRDEAVTMEKTKYPFSLPHHEDHQRCIEYLEDALDHLTKQPHLTNSLHWQMVKVKDQFLNHVDWYDIQMATWLHKNGHTDF